MIEISFTKEFIKTAKKLPKNQKLKLADQIEKLSKNPFDPSLYTKILKGKLSGYYSFRVGRDYRVIFEFEDCCSVKLLCVAHRKEIYKRMERK